MRRVIFCLLASVVVIALEPSKAATKVTVKPTAKSQLLEGGTPSVRRRFSDFVHRMFRLAKRLWRATTSTTTNEEEEEEAPPPPPSKKRPVKTVASRKASRIAKELEEFVANPPENCKVSMGKNMNVWIVTITGAKKTIFEGEKFKLRVAFPADYPVQPPSVYFLQPPPRHPHIYSNGDICLNLLGKDWRPNLTIAQLSLSILSMLSSAKQKGIPQDNALHAQSPPDGDLEGCCCCVGGTGTCTSTSTFTFPEGESYVLPHARAGVVSMAAASRFRITSGPAPHLDGRSVAFGRVVSGMEVVRAAVGAPAGSRVVVSDKGGRKRRRHEKERKKHKRRRRREALTEPRIQALSSRVNNNQA
ncbi:hypothetical protein CTAYLR_010121 [Chrysophaeum taylorii]|uniref:UBC core domain-containing protein n=1 Tax=Chrysophaeum taylorii TaxID=2483200 RepID=A0AAD7XNH4_9STRA|nr:hypothetical protein CTAYLR_010121 [Chrysophaeum taylorii]